ncbi:Putative protein [Zobellia galactanivorans]|uniref:Uncharacterized protein n=1 Tax=Zobellia galactanivorans (strain DSM 12802 / CCUG 47099 / CIP 106680 / NCIMB 13871 / Dsij) TaxID=63186 RepID=G0L9Z7_ZOBGA|nr:Putative protein [Zobellia galactanivorans]
MAQRSVRCYLVFSSTLVLNLGFDFRFVILLPSLMYFLADKTEGITNTMIIKKIIKLMTKSRTYGLNTS